LTVIDSILESIAVTPALPDNSDNLPIGSTQQFVATGTYSDTTTANITLNVTWVSSDEDVAYFNNYWDVTGSILVALAVGTTDITATLEGKTSNIIAVTVTGPSDTPVVTDPAAPVTTNAST